MEFEEIKKVKDAYLSQLLSLKHVVSVGIGKKREGGEETEETAIVIGVSQKLPLSLLEKSDIIPRALDQIKVDVIQVGEISVFPPLIVVSNRTQRIRPAKGGYSIGNIRVTAGTFGCVVYKGSEGYILSNAHVLVADPTEENSTPIEIVQPGVADGGTYPNDHIGNLADYVVIHPSLDFSQCQASQGIAGFLTSIAKIFGRQSRFQALAQSSHLNLVDAAICSPLSQDLIDPDVEGIGIPTGVLTGSTLFEKPVVKSGRTTEITRGKIINIDATVTVGYAPFLGIGTKYAQFENQLLIETPEGENRFSAGGDSGSVVFVDDGQRKVCGLLFAGNKEGTYTYANQIDDVLRLLDVQMTPS
ncbi:MAG: hypothetical protein JSW11_01825 [Candidatus Heimdallarchaeota archaeon]|nr:MAG: hypothetical protein JSW11_01825 [Candidatus Heimdallarchaeota archaeon]